MKPWHYLFVYIIPLLTLSGLYWGGSVTLLTPLTVFVLVPLAEFVLPRPEQNPDEEEAARRLANPLFDAVIYLSIPFQIGVIGYLLWQISSGALVGWEIAGAIFAVGLSNAGFGINTGHELGHRAQKHHQLAAKFLLGTTLYAHFFIEHNRGHHARVATPEDPATSRKIERYNRILAEEFLYARTWTSEDERANALERWNLHYNYHRPHGAADGQPPATLVPIRVNNLLASYT